MKVQKLQEIENIELAPSKVTSDLLKITMYDTDEIFGAIIRTREEITLL